MSNFAVEVRKLVVHPHPNADKIDLARIDDYQAVIPKNTFTTDDLAVYIPEAAIVPEAILEAMHLTGRLAGPQANRVKAIRLRGELSQGLVYRPEVWPEHWVPGYDVTEELGITKWEPPIPLELAGKVSMPTQFQKYATKGSPHFQTYHDIHNIKRYPDLFYVGEEVVVSEKLHGSCCITGIIHGEHFVCSKGLAGRGLVLDESAQNVYWRIAQTLDIFKKMEYMPIWLNYPADIVVFGEVIGVQDLMYGLSKGQLGYRAFDIMVNGQYLDFLPFVVLCDAANIPRVPVLYEGPYNREIVDQHTNGQSTLANHIREGVVVRPTTERKDPNLGRVIVKSISADYLLRGDQGTEFQ